LSINVDTTNSVYIFSNSEISRFFVLLIVALVAELPDGDGLSSVHGRVGMLTGMSTDCAFTDSFA
jgi:hypothetical protein